MQVKHLDWYRIYNIATFSIATIKTCLIRSIHWFQIVTQGRATEPQKFFSKRFQYSYRPAILYQIRFTKIKCLCVGTLKPKDKVLGAVPADYIFDVCCCYYFSIIFIDNLSNLGRALLWLIGYFVHIGAGTQEIGDIIYGIGYYKPDRLNKFASTR